MISPWFEVTLTKDCGSLACRDRRQWALYASVFSGLHWKEPRWEQISFFMGYVTPREEVSEEDKHKDKSSGGHLIFNTNSRPRRRGLPFSRQSL